MSAKPSGENGKKPAAQRVSNYKAKSTKPEARHKKQVEDDARRVRNMKKPRGLARAKRRAAGNFNPVNEAASLAQAPDGRFAKSMRPAKSKVIKEIEIIIGHTL